MLISIWLEHIDFYTSEVVIVILHSFDYKFNWIGRIDTSKLKRFKLDHLIFPFKMSSPQSDSFQILSENRLTLKLFNIYNNSDGFRLGLINISNGFYFILIILPSIIGISALVHNSIDFSLDFEQRSTSIDVGIGTMQMFFIYLTLIANKSIIIRTINRLQFVINESKSALWTKIQFRMCLIIR